MIGLKLPVFRIAILPVLAEELLHSRPQPFRTSGKARLLIPCGGDFGLGGHSGSFSVSIGVILSARTEYKDSLWGRVWDRIRTLLPLCLLCPAFREDLQGHSEMARTPEKPSFGPTEGSGRLHRNGGLRQEVGHNAAWGTKRRDLSHNLEPKVLVKAILVSLGYSVGQDHPTSA